MLRTDDGQIEVVAARNLDRETITGDRFEISRTIINGIIDSGEPLLTTNAAADPRFEKQASVVRSGLRSIMAAPLRARGRVIGVCYVDNRAAVGIFNTDDLAALEMFASQAAIAIENAQLFNATDQKLAARIEELQQLRQIDLELNETLDIDKTSRIILEWACRLADASVGHFGVPMIGGLPGGSPDELHVHAIYHIGVNEQETAPVYLDRLYPQTLDAVRTGESLRVQRGGSHLLIVPMWRDNRSTGVIVLRRKKPFTAEQQDLIERLTARGASALENARLYAEVQAADRAKSEFVGIVAHDLKVPMSSILGYVELTLLDSQLPKPLVKFQQRIRDTVRRMEVLVSDLADISRIESG
ncbi:MAG: GAF domain-containing protein, partial [Anaerolinea sp.]|nr:GAF domain-containing protein [Anaerolinea sp.]